MKTEYDVPFKPGTLPYEVMLGSLQGGVDGGWADLSIKEIAEVLGVTYRAADGAIKRIREKTGYEVPHANGWDKRREELDGM